MMVLKKNIIKNKKSVIIVFLNSQPDNPFLNDYKDTTPNLKKINKSKATAVNNTRNKARFGIY